MPRYIIKLADHYLEWSTVSDAPRTYGMTLSEFKEWYLEEYGHSSEHELEQRLACVEKKGTSCMLGSSLNDIIAGNRAGDKEKRLTKAEIIERYIVNRPKPKSMLCWDKPKKVMSTEQWKTHYSADGAPPGVWQPNMSREDELKWKAKLVRKTTDSPQVEIRRNGMVLIVSLGGGYKYKHYTPEETQGINVHMSLNGPQALTFDDVNDMQKAIAEAKTVLENLAKEKKDGKTSKGRKKDHR